MGGPEPTKVGHSSVVGGESGPDFVLGGIHTCSWLVFVWCIHAVVCL